jgi:hypothetical protein
MKYKSITFNISDSSTPIGVELSFRAERDNLNSRSERSEIIAPGETWGYVEKWVNPGGVECK